MKYLYTTMVFNT